MADIDILLIVILAVLCVIGSRVDKTNELLTECDRRLASTENDLRIMRLAYEKTREADSDEKARTVS